MNFTQTLASLRNAGAGILARRPTLDQMNLIFTAVVLGWGGVIGSAVSILFIGAILHAFIRLYQRKIAFPRDPRVLAIATAFAFYVAADTISGAINYDGLNTLSEIVETLPFLGFAFVYGRLALSKPEDVVGAVEYGAISGAYATFVFALAEIFFTSHVRAEAMAGNPGILAVISSVLYGFCLLGAIRRRGHMRWIALLAGVCAAATLLLTGMRALWPFLIVAPVILLVVLRPKIHWPMVRRGALIAAIPLLVVAYLTHGLIEKRMEALAVDIEGVESGDYDSSIGLRLILWRNGLELASERPLVGHGPGVARSEDPETIGFSHFHNFLLNAMVRSGILGVAAILGLFIVPLIVLVRQNHDEVSLTGLTILLSIQAAFLLSGSVGIMLGHDIHDSLFIYATIVASFLVLGRSTTLAESTNSTHKLSSR